MDGETKTTIPRKLSGADRAVWRECPLKFRLLRLVEGAFPRMGMAVGVCSKLRRHRKRLRGFVATERSISFSDAARLTEASVIVKHLGLNIMFEDD